LPTTCKFRSVPLVCIVALRKYSSHADWYLSQPPMADKKISEEQRHKSILINEKSKSGYGTDRKMKSLQFKEHDEDTPNNTSLHHINSDNADESEASYEGPQDPLPAPPPRSVKSQGRVGKQEPGDLEDVNPGPVPVDVTSQKNEPLPPLHGRTPPVKGRVAKVPVESRVEQITDEDEKRKFEELRGAVLSVSSYAGHVCENIDKFFKYNKNNIVRPSLKVDELEQKKARTWVFFLLLIQFIVCAVFLGAVAYLGKNGYPYAGWFFAGSLGLYFVMRLFSVLIFCLRNLNKGSHCCASAYDPNNERYEEVFICIPAYNEGKEAFMNTISSISATNYPKHRMYMFFIVDGNKAASFENLMECLLKKPYDEPVPPRTRLLKHGVYDGIPYSVFLKEENRGKRDSQWLFVELLRNMIPEFAPGYVFFVDSDTAFHPDSLRFMVEDFKDDPKIAGVCGKLTLSNFKFFSRKLSNTFYFLSTMFVVGFQYYEYHYNQIVGKQSEAAYSAVSCLPGAFSVFRANILTNVEARVGERMDEELSSQVIDKMGPFSLYYYKVKQTLPLVLDDFFSKPTNGIIDRNLYELGEDRTLTIRFLERGLKCLYEPRAVAYTECPDGIVKYFQQRRRWNNSTFINLCAMVVKPGLWCTPRCIPVQIFSLLDLFGSYILPANSLLLMYVIWNPMFEWIGDHTSIYINAAYVIAILLALQALVVMTTNIVTADMFYVFLTFIQGLLMVVAFPWFIIFVINIVHQFEADPGEYWAPVFILALFPVLHTIMSVTHPPSFFTVVYWWVMIPTSALTLPMYSFVHLDDFSWGNR